ncbi:MAG: hypothetical protein Q8R40_01720 [bacterium]|nr:hypothetical protein [bacterium]
MTRKVSVLITAIFTVLLLQTQINAQPRVAAGDILVGEIEGIQSRFLTCCFGVRLEIASVSETGEISGIANVTPRDGSEIRSVPFTGKVSGSGVTFTPEGAFKFPSSGSLQWKEGTLVGQYTIETSKPGLQLTGKIKLAPLTQKSEAR